MLAGALRGELRRSDEAYRIGGDEFGVILPGAARLDAERVMRRLRAVAAAGELDSGDPIEASFGIGVYNRGDDPGARGGRGRRGALQGEAPARGVRGVNGRLVAAGAVVGGAIALALRVAFDPAEGTGPTAYEGGARFGEIVRYVLLGAACGGCVERLRAGARGGLLWAPPRSWRGPACTLRARARRRSASTARPGSTSWRAARTPRGRTALRST